MKRGEIFAQLVHQILISEKKYSIKQVAARMGLTYESLYARATNRILFSADEIQALLRSTPEPRLASYILDGSGLLAVDRSPPSLDAPEDTMWKSAHRVVFESTDILRAIETALTDGKIDRREIKAVQTEIDAAERVLLALREHLRRLERANAAPGAAM